MPAGSPGMGGNARSPLTVYAFADGQPGEAFADGRTSEAFAVGGTGEAFPQR